MSLTQVAPGLLNTTAQYYGFKNRIINGGMQIAQYSTSSITAGNNGATSNTYSAIDRWGYLSTQASKFTFQQLSSSPPVGFSNYLGVTSSSAYSVGSGDIFTFNQVIEANNVADLQWGTANAKTVTLSFWVQSSLTGTFGGSVKSYGNNYAYPFQYTISSANTWTYISITITGPTTGTWNTGNAGQIYCLWALGVGSTFTSTAGSWQAGNYVSANSSVNVVGTSGATWYLTGVQLEVGSTATSFDYRPYGTELALCQRYYWATTQTYLFSLRALNPTTTNAGLMTMWPVTMRTTPTAVNSVSNANISSLAVSGITQDGAYWTGAATSSVSTATISGLNASAEL
jgi:hypothetical protein